MSLRPDSEAISCQNNVPKVANRLLGRIRGELLELGDEFEIDSDLFEAGLDSMAIMQVILMVEEEFETKLPDRLVKRTTFSTARQIAQAVCECGNPLP